jgi:Zn-dependent peptidase ImmA (M78 family)
MAKQLRAELGLAAHDPLCPRRLAIHRGFLLLPLSEFRCHEPTAVDHLMNKDPSAFSAVTIVGERKRLIIYNDVHHSHRQNADIAHELGHEVLKHPPMLMMDELGCREYPEDLEEEANWMGPAILISREAAMHIVKTSMSEQDASEVYGASEDVVRMRINVTGVKQQFARSKRRSLTP